VRLLDRKRGLKAEHRVAKREKGKVTPGSGNQWHSKGDVKSDARLIQVKSTVKKSYAITLKSLDEIERQAAAVDREPAFVIEFVTPQGKRCYEVSRYFGAK